MNPTKQIELVNVTDGVIQVYRNGVKNNKNDSVKLIRKKLTRNILCGQYLGRKKGKSVYGYGCLRIYIKNNLVLYIKNHCKPVEIDRKLKNKLDIDLGIVKVSFWVRVKNLLKVG